jgi:hypothetical protein
VFGDDLIDGALVWGELLQVLLFQLRLDNEFDRLEGVTRLSTDDNPFS